MANTWKNNDGLYLKTGTTEATPSIAGEYNFDGATHEVEIDLNWTKLTNSAQTIIEDNFFLPKGALIEKVTTVATKAFAGSGFVFNIGLMKMDRSTTYDADGLIAAQALSTVDAVGETTETVLGSTYAGSSIGTVLTERVYLTADYDTAAPTDGNMRVRIFYSMHA